MNIVLKPARPQSESFVRKRTPGEARNESRLSSRLSSGPRRPSDVSYHAYECANVKVPAVCGKTHADWPGCPRVVTFYNIASSCREISRSLDLARQCYAVSHDRRRC